MIPQSMRLFLTLLLLAGVASAAQMSWLENDEIKLGVDLDHGGAITFLAAKKDGTNVINNFDFGRQVQLSFYSGPVPFEANGQKPADHWKHIGWNPIQTGDDFKNSSRIVEHENDGKRIHLTCIPLQWPLNNVPGECTFESWLELDGKVVKARARLNNQRSDHTQYPARFQELPAVYANAEFHRVVSYQGTRPFTGDAIAPMPKPEGKHPWSFWKATECWSALLNESDYGLGLVTPGVVHYTGGFAGKPGPNDTHGNSTGYLAGQAQEILDHNIQYDFKYELVLGSLDHIRERASQWKPKGPPQWIFDKDRQGWHYQNAADQGWPVDGMLHISLDKDDPQLISPMTFWKAEDAPYLVLDAAFKTSQQQGVVMWQAHSSTGYAATHVKAFPIVADGGFHRHVIHLGAQPEYKEGVVRLRIDPVGQGELGAWIKVRSVKLAKTPEE